MNRQSFPIGNRKAILALKTYLAVRSKVRCTTVVFHEVFQNIQKHTKSKHKDLHAPQTPLTIELDKSDTRQSKAVSLPLPQTSTRPHLHICMFTILILNSQSGSWQQLQLNVDWLFKIIIVNMQKYCRCGRRRLWEWRRYEILMRFHSSVSPVIY